MSSIETSWRERREFQDTDVYFCVRVHIKRSRELHTNTPKYYTLHTDTESGGAGEARLRLRLVAIRGGRALRKLRCGDERPGCAWWLPDPRSWSARLSVRIPSVYEYVDPGRDRTRASQISDLLHSWYPVINPQI